MSEAIARSPAARLPRLLLGRQRLVLPPRLEGRIEQIGSKVEEIVVELHRDPHPHRSWLFVPSAAGYAFVEHRGSTVAHGDTVSLDGTTYRVSVVSRSPFGDELPCAYLEAL